MDLVSILPQIIIMQRGCCGTRANDVPDDSIAVDMHARSLKRVLSGGSDFLCGERETAFRHCRFPKCENDEIHHRCQVFIGKIGKSDIGKTDEVISS